MFEVKKINQNDAIITLKEEESHFFDIIIKDYRGEALQKKCVAFLNADGGEILIGIHDTKAKKLPGGKFERWEGFGSQEDANNAIADITNNITPSITNVSYEFIEIDGHEELGKILRVILEKSPDVHYTAGKNVYQRKGAQCLAITGDQITNLKLSKGAQSFENQKIDNYEIDRLFNSDELKNFLSYYHPKTELKNFLKKQGLIQNENAIYAGVLLYDENPSTVLPKKAALKITWYDTTDKTPTREHIKEQETIEGPLHHQINSGINVIERIINAVPIMGPTGLEKAKYPPEAIKEILVNALIHRDYNISDDVSVLIFNNRIEVHSPGALPGFITTDNILNERFSRNPKIVRLLNKYPDIPNHDIGEGLNTAFQKMKEVRLKDPIIIASTTKVIVKLPHEPLASPQDQILQYLDTHAEINNRTARELTGIGSENVIKSIFKKLEKYKYIEMVPNKKGPNIAWRKKDQINPDATEVKKSKGLNQQTLF